MRISLNLMLWVILWGCHLSGIIGMCNVLAAVARSCWDSCDSSDFPIKGKSNRPFQSHHCDDVSRGFLKKGKSLHKSLIPKSLWTRTLHLLAQALSPNLQRTNYPCFEMAGVEGRRKRSQHRTRTTMDLNPTPKAFRNQEVEDYLVKYGVRLASNVKVEWCLQAPIIQSLLRLGVCTFIPKC